MSANKVALRRSKPSAMFPGMGMLQPLMAYPMIADWLSFESVGRVAVFTGKAELGQGIVAALQLIAAEELDIEPEKIDMVSADTALTPDEGLTAGSFSMETAGNAVRLASSAARRLLISALAKQRAVDVEKIETRDGRFVVADHPANEDYWTLAASTDLEVPVTEWASPKAPDCYRFIGHRDSTRTDRPERLAGAAYLHDLEFPRMLHGRTLRAPHWRSRAQPPEGEALGKLLPQGTQFHRDGNFLAVVAERESDAVRACECVEAKTTWIHRSFPHADPFQEIETSVEPFTMAYETPRGAAEAATTVEVTCSRRFLAHGAIGPSCAIALYDEGVLTVWSHSQGVFELAGSLARLMTIEEAQIHVIHVPAAGCYGHNGADDVAADAALLARVHPGRHVRVQWSRAQELTTPLGAPMRTTVRAEIGADGRLGHWDIDTTGGAFGRRPGFGFMNLLAAYLRDEALTEALMDMPLSFGGGLDRNTIPLYDLPSVRIRKRVISDLSTRTSSLRSLGAHINVAALEATMDEAARSTGADPVKFRLDHLSDARARDVIERAAEMAKWPALPNSGRALGLGFAKYKNSAGYCAVIAEVSVDEEVRLHHLWCAVDVGLAIDLDGIISQVEGGLIQAASWTLKEEVKFEDGLVSSLSWETYPILRFSEIPEITVEVINRPNEKALGAGEITSGPTAAAICNAVARSLGMRLGDLPLTRERLVEAFTKAEA